MQQKGLIVKRNHQLDCVQLKFLSFKSLCTRITTQSTGIRFFPSTFASLEIQSHSITFLERRDIYIKSDWDELSFSVQFPLEMTVNSTPAVTAIGPMYYYYGTCEFVLLKKKLINKHSLLVIYFIYIDGLQIYIYVLEMN